MIGVLTLAEPLAKSGEASKSGPLGLAVILILCVVCYFLFKSMSRHLRKVRDDFPRDGAERADPAPSAKPEVRPAPADPRAQDDAS